MSNYVCISMMPMSNKNHSVIHSYTISVYYLVQYMSLSNTELSLTCSCSTVYDSSSLCDNVYDGQIIPTYSNSGGWYSSNGDSTPHIQLNFPAPAAIGRITVFHGCWTFEQCPSFTLTFSDGSEQIVSCWYLVD